MEKAIKGVHELDSVKKHGFEELEEWRDKHIVEILRSRGSLGDDQT